MNEEKRAEMLRQAQQWAEMFKSLADVLSTLAETCSDNNDEWDGPNVYLREGRDERALRQVVSDALAESSRHGIHHLMQYKYQWHALWRELELRGWIGGGRHGLAQFCRQMTAWFPDVRVGFDYKGVAKGSDHRFDVPYEQAERWFREKL